MNEKRIYKFNDWLLFRICSFEDCTKRKVHWGEHIKCEPFALLPCNHVGSVHFHCVRHKEVELAIENRMNGPRSLSLICAICASNGDNRTDTRLERLTLADITTLQEQALALSNSEKFKNAQLVRLDDYYMPELSGKDLASKESKYWLSYNVKENRYGQPILILYLGDRKDHSKIQFFVEPETKKLSHDHTNDTPLSVIAKIEVEFKDGVIELKNKEK